LLYCAFAWPAKKKFNRLRPRLGPDPLQKHGKSCARLLVNAGSSSQGNDAGRPLTGVTTDTIVMKSLTLMLIAGVALPIGAIAQTTAPAPPADATGTTTVADPAMTTTNATTTDAMTTAAPDSTSNTTAAEPDRIDTKAKKKKKKPVEATEPRL
jgi:hypothetical protein